MVIALAVLAPATIGSQCEFESSPYVEAVPAPGGCDVVIDEANSATTLGLLDDPTKRVFCVEPGDYRAAGKVVLAASGSRTSRRFLRFNAPDGSLEDIEQRGQAVFESIRIDGSWWVVQGLSVVPKDPATQSLVTLRGGDHNVLEGNLIDASEQWNVGLQQGVTVSFLGSDPATYNSIQSNLIRGGNRSRIGVDYAGVLIGSSLYPGGNDFNKILDNEISDWGDGIQLSESPECDSADRPHGTLIDGNDIYITAAKRVDCADGSPDPDGDCSCSENGIDVKPDPGSHPSLWTRITNNRLWGFRPTLEPSCGGSGSRGQAINAGNQCAGHVLVARNIVLDATTGVSPVGPGWVIAGNLFYDIRVPLSGRGGGGTAISPSLSSSGLDVQFNTVVDVDNAYDDGSSNTDTRCNAVIDNVGVAGPGVARGFDHVTAYNYLYHSSTANFVGVTNQSRPTASESLNSPYCFLRRRWTGPEWVCVPFGHTEPESPHTAAASNCDPGLASPFGLPVIGYR
jgi:hypothetical protein